MNLDIWGALGIALAAAIGFIVWLELSLRRMLRQAKEEED